MPEMEAVVSAVAAAGKYRGLCEDTIRRVAEREVARLGQGRPVSVAAAVKATKRRLHQVYGAFEGPCGEGGPRDPAGGRVDAVLEPLAAAYGSGSEAEVRAACRHLLGMHQSTRERLAILDRFYPALWAVTGRPSSLLDVGCGLNPLALPWMELEADCRYAALDIDCRRVELLNRAFSLAGREPLARCQDALVEAPGDEVDVALLLKMSPTLERQEPGATARLVERLKARAVAVSFAVRSLGGREVGMAAQYERQFLAWAAARRWTVERLAFETELVFVVQGDLG